MGNQQQFPEHVAVIMDGNGRWAKLRGMPRNVGHKKGAETFKKRLDDFIELGIKYVTFFAFSTENWSRPKDEVESIMQLFDTYLDEIMSMKRKDARIVFIGNRAPLSESIKMKMDKVEKQSADNVGTTCAIAFNYGSRLEITQAAAAIAADITAGKIGATEVTDALFSSYLYTGGMPDVDLMIRPSGELRLSNFLLWQSAYAELVFMDVLWPDFSKSDLMAALEEYSQRERRFGV